MKQPMPRIEISLSQIRENTRILSGIYGKKGMSLMGVTKAVSGRPSIAQAMIDGGVKFIADSRIENIQRMRNAEISSRYVLLRTPFSQAETIVLNADISLNTEIETLKELSYFANFHNKPHHVIIMIESGDLREGVLPCDLVEFIKKTLTLPNIKVDGIGSNLACHGGIKPDETNMKELSDLAELIEKKFKISLEIISGGNSANYDWVKSTTDTMKINNLRIGESILLGRETLNRNKIQGLYTNAFKIVAEIIESKTKPSIPWGKSGQDSFGNIPQFKNKGTHQRTIISLGKQDVSVSSLTPVSDDYEIIGSSSDHLIIDSNNMELKIGDYIEFDTGYAGLLSAMTSPFIKTVFV